MYIIIIASITRIPDNFSADIVDLTLFWSNNCFDCTIFDFLIV